jgi:tripartite-type tricarboxylate transporter receptor subunit TctC
MMLATAPLPASAQSYPERPITIVIPSSPGGPADVSTRIISDKLSQILGQPIVIETVAGAGGTIGMGRVARAAPDGYTLMVHQSGFAITPALYAKLNFDTVKDFVTVGLINQSASVLLAREGIPAKTYNELVEWLKGPGKPGKYAHPGPGTWGHLFTVLHIRSMGVDMSAVSYRGIAPAVNDLLGGHVDIAMVGAAVATPQVQSGKLKAFAATTKMANLPDVPSFGALGQPDLEKVFWHAVFAPAATPRPILEKLNKALNETMADPAIKAAYAKSSLDAYPPEQTTLEAANAYVQKELEFWGKIVRDNNVKVE